MYIKKNKPRKTSRFMVAATDEEIRLLDEIAKKTWRKKAENIRQAIRVYAKSLGSNT